MVVKRFCCDGAAVERYYTNQVGTGLPVFRGNRTQTGHGLGSMFKGLLKSVAPLVKSGAKALGKQALSTGLDITRDVMSGQNFKDAARQRLRETGTETLRKVQNKMQSAVGQKSIKRMRSPPIHTSRPSKRRKRTSRRNKRDIFDS